MNKFCKILLYLAWWTVFCAAAPAHAHRVVVFAWIDGDTVYTESSFPDGRRITEGEITVYDSRGAVRASGKPDANGNFSFKLPDADLLRIVLNAGMGHQGEWVVPETEIRSAFSNADSSPGSPVEAPHDVPARTAHEPAKRISPPGTGGLDETSVRRVVESVLDEKLKPIKKSLAEIRQNEGPSLSDIFGGIGYILGLMGIAAWFYSKKK